VQRPGREDWTAVQLSRDGEVRQTLRAVSDLWARQGLLLKTARKQLSTLEVVLGLSKKERLKAGGVVGWL
jgi:hypothetical protein